MTYRVIFTAEAGEHLNAISDFITDEASAEVAASFTDAIVAFCESFETFPHRGNLRDDIRPGLRVTHFKKRVVIAFSVIEDAVLIIGVFYGGQDYESVLQ